MDSRLKLDQIVGDGIGAPWLEWCRKVDLVPPGADLLDHLDRTDWPGTEEAWEKFRRAQVRAKAVCGLDLGNGIVPPTEAPPHRIPHGMWRSIGQLDQTVSVDDAGVWTSDYANPDTRSRRGLLLVGPIGSGKTAIAAAIAHDLDGHAFWQINDLVDHLQEGYGSNSYRSRFDALARRRLLIIDDLGAERDTDAQTHLVVDLLDRRYRHGVKATTVITTNLTGPHRTQRYGARFESRLRDMCATLTVVGNDRRAA